MRKLYESNMNFRNYVNKYCRNYSEGKSIAVEEALQHEIVRQTGEMYRKKEEEQNAR